MADVDWSQYDAKPPASPPASGGVDWSKYDAKPRPNGMLDTALRSIGEVSDTAGKYVADEVVRPLSHALGVVRNDYAESASGKPAPIDPLHGEFGETGRSLRNVADIAAVPLAPIAGAIHGTVIRPAGAALNAATGAVPMYEQPTLKSTLAALAHPNTNTPAKALAPEQRQQAAEGVVNTALMGLMPEARAGVLSGVAARYGPKAAAIVSDVPAEIAVGADGALTEEGREIAARAGLHPEDVSKAYEAASPPEAANDAMPVANPQDFDTGQVYYHGTATDAADLKPSGAKGADARGRPDVGEGLYLTTDPELASRYAEWRSPGAGANVRPLFVRKGAAIPDPNEPGAFVVKNPEDAVSVFDPAFRAEAGAAEAGGEGIAPPSPEGVPGATPVAEEPLPSSAGARVAQAGSEGVNLSRAQATQDFAAQDAEQTLKAQASGEGEAARQFFAKQQDQIAAAVDRFKAAFGDVSATAAERGQLVKDALRQLRDQGKAGVSALYKQAQEAAANLGDNAKSLLDLDTAPILAKMRELQIDETVPQPVRSALRQQMAKYGLIGKNARTIEGVTTVELADEAGNVGERIKFTGPPQKLSIDNAEDFRQTINDLYDADTSKRTQGLKPLIDDAVEAAIIRADEEGAGLVDAPDYKGPRAAHQEQQRTFSAKDIIQRLIDWRVKGVTDTVLPEHAIRSIFAGGPEAISNLRRVKAVLLNKATSQSRAAWEAIQAHGVADIFAQALTPRGEISGFRLNTAIKKFGPDKLKVLLSPEDFNQLMKLRRIVGDATIPLEGTTNPSGSGFKVIRFLAEQGVRLSNVARHVPVVGPIVDAAKGLGVLAKQGREAAAARSTLEGVTNFTPEAAANADGPAPKPAASRTEIPPDPVEYIRKFLTVAGGTAILAPLLSTSSQQDRP